MVNINLADSAYHRDNTDMLYSRGLIGVFSVLFIVVAAYLWILFAGKSTDSKLETATSGYTAEYATLTGSGNADIVDFKNRVTIAKDLIDQEQSGYAVLPATEQSMVPGAYLKSFNYDQTKKTVSVDGVADNFDVLAKQILSFKKSTYFSDVSSGNTSLDKDGKVAFTLSLNIK